MKIIQEWEALVEDFDDERVYLRLHDLKGDSPEEQGSFPRVLFEGVTLADGAILSVRVYDNQTITIENLPSQYDQEKSKIVYEEFTASIEKFR